MRAKGLKKINVKPLVERIEDLVRMFGGPHLAFDMEWKIRLFVIEVMNYAIVMSSAKANFYVTDEPKLVSTSLANPIDLDLEEECTIGVSDLYSQNPYRPGIPNSFPGNTLRLDGEKGIE